MTTKKARDFLDKELLVKRGIVTFRSLSRELRIHVNDAKNELQYYYDAVRDTDAPAVPTYLVSGEVPALTVSPLSGTQQSESAMEVDLEFEEDQEEEKDVVYQNEILLVDAHTLDEAMSQFSRVHSVHIYSLSPSRFRDAGLVCTPSFKVHKADIKGGPESFSVVGKITGSHVKLRAGAVNQSAASSSKTTLDVPVKVAPKLVAPTKAEQQITKSKTSSSDTKGHISTTIPPMKAETKDRPKPSGKLDWSKAKTKGQELVAERTKEEKKPKLEPNSPVATMDSSTSKKPGLRPTKSSVFKSKATDVVSGDAQKRGTKRKPLVDTDLESESESSAKAKPSMAATLSVKQGILYSDDDDDSEVRMLGQRRIKRKSTVTSDSEMSLRAMMDIDDEQVDCVSRISKVRALREEEEESEESANEPEKEATVPPAATEDDESDHVPIVPVQKKRKPRKVVPVGRNGLKKRRVIKSRMTTDAKGYMQTEDYSSYESVEEEEEEELTKPKGKGKGKETKKASEPTDKVEEARPKVVEESVGKPRAKPLPRVRGGPKRGGLLNFFGPERGKK